MELSEFMALVDSGTEWFTDGVKQRKVVYATPSSCRYQTPQQLLKGTASIRATEAVASWAKSPGRLSDQAKEPREAYDSWQYDMNLNIKGNVECVIACKNKEHVIEITPKDARRILEVFQNE